ncbi:MAG: DinB family protein [Bacteroidetes bacterium]|nr:DinB family protein [Bacteroidota bacterium]
MNDKASVISAISSHVEYLSSALMECPEDLLNRPIDGKWSVAEQVTHLNKSVAPLNLAMSLPKLTFYIFGKVSFSRSYDDIKALYQSKLSSGATASKAYVPHKGDIYEKARLKNDFTKAYNNYIFHIEKWTESDLDTYRLPHPVLGKLTLREMAYFTKYHLGHHLESIRQFAGE